MTPIERIRAREHARSVLGVDGSAKPADIDRAYKRQAFANHPDRPDATGADLCSINAAYELLKQDRRREEAATVAAPTARTLPRRPRVAPRLHDIDELTQARARAVLKETPDEESRDHVATRIRREGRKLVFLVPSRLVPGRNRVAVPADVLASTKNLSTKVVSFRTSNGGSGQVCVPTDRVKLDFPGATEVVLQFGVTRS